MAMGVTVTDTPGYYSTVAAGATDQTLTGHPDASKTGAIGDFLDEVLVIPGTTSPGAVSVKDGATSITLFTGGATSVADLKPFTVPVKAKGKGAGWKITTGSIVTALAKGNFTYGGNNGSRNYHH